MNAALFVALFWIKQLSTQKVIVEHELKLTSTFAAYM